MKEIAEWLLGRIINEDNNEVAKRLLDIIESAPNINNIDWLTLFAGSSTGENVNKKNPLQIESKENRDFRIEKVKIRGFRKFPFKDKGYYILDFTDSEKCKPCSCFFIGSNGSGKTSIFSSLQETCSGSFTAAESRGVEKKFFMPHVGKDASFVDVIVETCLGEIELQNPANSQIFQYRQFLRPFFCSEYDIRMMAESKDITGYIVSQTGFEYTYKLLNHLNTMYTDCCLLKDDLVKKKETAMLSDKGELKTMHKKYDFLNSVFDDVVDYRYRYRKNLVKLQLSSLIGKLKTPLKIKSINRNSKNYTRDIIKAGEQLSGILERLKDEYDILKNKKLVCPVVDETYQSLVYRITELLVDFESIKSENSTENVTKFNTRRIRVQAFHRRLILLGLDDINETRLFYAELLEKLQISITEDEKPKGFVENLLNEIDKCRSISKDEDFSESDKLSLLEEKLDVLKVCVDKLQNLYHVCLYKSCMITKNFCEAILTEFNTSDEKLDLKVISNTGRLEFDYIIDGNHISPLLYLNSFRFKLYTLCIKIGMAFSVMKMMNISFPLVLDDVFYSSDFSNREMVRLFIKKTFELYHKEIESTTSKRLQIIFFTHDEVILEAAINGMKEMDDIYKYGRIFNYQEMEASNADIKNNGMGNPDCNISVIFS